MMRPEELKERSKQFDQFGKLLLKRYRHNLAQQTEDKPTECLGRYLRATRANAGLSPTELASQAGLPVAVILVLETGLIPANDIEPTWLRRLATALAEDVDDLKLILGPQTPKRRPLAWLKTPTWWRSAKSALQPKPITALVHTESHLPLRSIYAAGLMLFVCLMAVAFWQGAPNPTKLPLLAEEQGSTVYLSQIAPEKRLSLIKAESRLRNRVWIADRLYLRFNSETPLTVAQIDFDTRPPSGFSPLGNVGPSAAPERLNMLQAEQQLKIAALIQPAYAPIHLEASCCGLQP